MAEVFLVVDTVIVMVSLNDRLCVRDFEGLRDSVFEGEEDLVTV